MLADSTCGVKGRERGIKEDSRALEQLCRWLAVLFTEMGNIERIWGVKDKLFCDVECRIRNTHQSGDRARRRINEQWDGKKGQSVR